MRIFLGILLIVSLLSACKSSFEQVRTSNNTELILKESLSYYEKGDYLRAQTLMELVLNQYRGTPQGEELFFKYAYTHYNLNNFQLAATYFTNFATTFPYSQYAEEANFMIAYSYFKQSPSFRLDQQSSNDAINSFQGFVDKFPDSERVPECNELIDQLRIKLEEKAYHEGLLYYNLSQYEAAITSFHTMLIEYPESPHAEYVRYLILKSAYQYAANSVYDKRKERYADAEDRYKEYISRYPSGDNAHEARDIHKQIELDSKHLAQ